MKNVFKDLVLSRVIASSLILVAVISDPAWAEENSVVIGSITNKSTGEIIQLERLQDQKVTFTRNAFGESIQITSPVFAKYLPQPGSISSKSVRHAYASISSGQKLVLKESNYREFSQYLSVLKQKTKLQSFIDMSRVKYPEVTRYIEMAKAGYDWTHFQLGRIGDCVFGDVREKGPIDLHYWRYTRGPYYYEKGITVTSNDGVSHYHGTSCQASEASQGCSFNKSNAQLIAELMIKLMKEDLYWPRN